MNEKKKRNLKRRQDLLQKINPGNASKILNSIYEISPVLFDTPAQQRQIRAKYPSASQNLTLFTLNMMRLHRCNSGKKVAICCMPKSGSTYFLTSLRRLPEQDFQIDYIHVPYRNPSFVDAELRENELDELALLKVECQRNNIITQLHMKASPYSDKMFARNNYKVLVVQRNIFDCIVSMDDMICEGKMPGFAMVRPPSSYRKWPREKRLSYLCHIAGPWYVDFAISWARTGLRPLFLSYENDVLGFSEDTARRIQAHLQIDGLELAQISEAFELKSDQEKTSARLNVGISGRGQDIPTEVRQQLIELTKYYQGEIDFANLV